MAVDGLSGEGMVSEDIDPKTIIETLRRWAERIPDYRQLSTREIIALRRAATMPRDWIVAAVNAAGASSDVQSVIRSTPPEMLDEMTEIDVWQAVETEVRSFLKGVADSNLIRRHRLGLKTLRIYGISRHLVREAGHENLSDHVETMKQMRKLGKRKPKAEK
jgi:hypothetical protein